VKLSIIIPVYNEEQTISEVVERVRAVDIGDVEKEIIIANDGSSDGTRLSIDSSRWISDPRIAISFITWGICLAMVFLRITAGWRGRKAAIMAITVLGCSAITWVAHNGLRLGVTQ